MDQLDIIKKTLKEILATDENAYIVFIDGNEGLTLPHLREQYPDRMIRCGISESNGMSVAAGLALCGKNVFIISFSAFLSSRAIEQIKLDVAYNNANVKILAYKTGFKFNATAGYSHWAVDDIAALRTLPNLTILTPLTLEEMRAQLLEAYKHQGPFYLRIENLHSSLSLPLASEKSGTIILTKGNTMALVACGSMAEYAYHLSVYLKKIGINICVVNVNSIKPFDENPILDLINKNIPIITIEEQTYGGLSSIISEVIAKSGKKLKFKPILIEDSKFNFAGKYEWLANQLLHLNSIPEQVINFSANNITFLKIPVITEKYKFTAANNIQKRYKLFNIIPLLKMKYKENKRKYFLFDILPILKIKYKGKKVKYYLFGLIQFAVKDFNNE